MHRADNPHLRSLGPWIVAGALVYKDSARGTLWFSQSQRPLTAFAFPFVFLNAFADSNANSRRRQTCADSQLALYLVAQC